MVKVVMMVDVALVILEAVMAMVDGGVNDVECNGGGSGGDSGSRSDGDAVIAILLMVVIAITMAMGMEMMVVVVMVMVMKTEAIDNGDGDNNYDSQESSRSTHQVYYFLYTPDYLSNTLWLSYTLLSILNYFRGIRKLAQPIKILCSCWFPEEYLCPLVSFVFGRVIIRAVIFLISTLMLGNAILETYLRKTMECSTIEMAQSKRETPFAFMNHA